MLAQGQIGSDRSEFFTGHSIARTHNWGPDAFSLSLLYWVVHVRQMNPRCRL